MGASCAFSDFLVTGSQTDLFFVFWAFLNYRRVVFIVFNVFFYYLAFLFLIIDNSLELFFQVFALASRLNQCGIFC